MHTQASGPQRTFNRVSCGLTEAGIALSAPAIRVVFMRLCPQAWDVHSILTEGSSHDKPKWSLAQRCTYSSYSAFPMSRQASYKKTGYQGYLLPWHCNRPTTVPRTSVLMLIFDSLACSTRGADGLSWQRDISQLTLSLCCVQAKNVSFFPVLSWGSYRLWLDYSAIKCSQPYRVKNWHPASKVSRRTKLL